jgi:uncharacterized protein (UPF0335 family)
LRTELEIVRTELADAVRRLNRLEEELEEVRATVKQLWMKIDPGTGAGPLTSGGMKKPRHRRQG